MDPQKDITPELAATLDAALDPEPAPDSDDDTFPAPRARRRFRMTARQAVSLGVGVALAVGLLRMGLASSGAPALGLMPLVPTANFAQKPGDGTLAYEAQTAPGGTTDQLAGNSGGAKTQAAPNTPWDRMIIRTAQLQVQVKDVGATMDSVRGLVSQYNGVVMTTNSTGSGPDSTATLTIQVPSAEFDRVIPQLRHLASKVLSEQVGSQDVTEEYTDLQSQLRNLQATESRMLALQAKADKIEDILTVDRELRSVQADIERIQGRVNYLSKRSDMSTITLSLVPDSVPVPVATTGWDPAAVATRAWYASLDLLANAANIAITVFVFLWWAVPLLLIAGLVLRPRLRRTA